MEHPPQASTELQLPSLLQATGLQSVTAEMFLLSAVLIWNPVFLDGDKQVKYPVKIIELTADGNVMTPALGNPETPVGSWAVDVLNKRITITAIGSYALFGSADINFEFLETTKIHVQSSFPITALIGLSEKDLFKKSE